MTTIIPTNATIIQDPTVTVVYSLSEAGRKYSLLNHGDGHHFQFIILHATKELLDLATITESGEAYIFLNPHIPYDVGPLGNQYGWDLIKLRQAGFQFSCPRRKAIVRKHNLKWEGVLVALDHESPDTLAHHFDYDKPFTSNEIATYVLSIPKENTDALQAAEKIASEKNKEEEVFYKQQQLSNPEENRD
jgi:hypothetical protein